MENNVRILTAMICIFWGLALHSLLFIIEWKSGTPGWLFLVLGVLYGIAGVMIMIEAVHELARYKADKAIMDSDKQNRVRNFIE
jgi:hypothetical protein